VNKVEWKPNMPGKQFPYRVHEVNKCNALLLHPWTFNFPSYFCLTVIFYIVFYNIQIIGCILCHREEWLSSAR